MLPLATFRLLWKSRLNPHYRQRLWERFALKLPKALPHSLLVHTVSVGEFLALRPLLLSILHNHPTLNLYLTCTTPTGSAQIQALQTQFPNRIVHSYLPYDAPFLTKRFVRHVQPRLLILMETEIWRNLILSAHQQGVPVLLENARLSAKSCRAYARFARPLMREVLPLITINAQHRFDAKRFVFLGADPQKIHITPNLKYHVPTLNTPQEPAPESALIWIAASTHAPEEAVILKAHQCLQQIYPKALLYLAPRHPERRQEIVSLIQEHGYQAQLRSQESQPQADANRVFVLDTLGELSTFYAHSHIAFIGGSLFGRGGHNPLEALHQGNSLCFGVHTHNFAHICAELSTKRFVRVITNSTPESVCHAILELYHDAPHHQTDKALYLKAHAQILAKHESLVCQLAKLESHLL